MVMPQKQERISAADDGDLDHTVSQDDIACNDIPINGSGTRFNRGGTSVFFFEINILTSISFKAGDNA